MEDARSAPRLLTTPPPVRTVDYAEQRSGRKLHAVSEPWLKRGIPRRPCRADLEPAIVPAVPDQVEPRR